MHALRQMPVAMAAFTAACGASPDGSRTVLRDSAGVRIVENVADLDGNATLEWTVSSEPLFAVGTSSGDPADELYRVSYASRLEDGRVVVANSGTGELRYFGADGSHLMTTGSIGYGPGEFRAISWMRQLPDDSVLVFDGGLYRFTVLDPNGAVARDFIAAPLLDGLSIPVAMMSGGRLVVVNGRPMSSNTPGIQPEYGTYLITDLAGTVLDTLGRFPMREIYVQFRGEIRSTTGRPFSPWTSVAASSTAVYVTRGNSYRIDAFDHDGRLQRSIRLNLSPQPVTDQGIDAYIAERSGTRSFRSAVGSGTPDDLPFPETYPVIGRLVIDPLNYLWVREYASPESAAQQWWHIHDSDGQWVGRIAFASDLAVFEIGIDYVLGLTHNEDGVETVRLFALDRRQD